MLSDRFVITDAQPLADSQPLTLERMPHHETEPKTSNIVCSAQMLSRHLIHRLGYTYKKIPDCNGALPEKGAHCAIRVATLPPA